MGKLEIIQFFKKFKSKSIKELTVFSLPIILGQIGVMLIAVGDMYIASMHSTLSVGAIGVATGVFNPVFLLGIGLMMGLSPSLAIERGKGEDIGKYLFDSIIYSIICGIILASLMVIVNRFVPYMGIEKEMIPYIMRYIDIIAWSFPFAYIFQAIKEFLQSYEDVFFANLISIIAVFVNVLLNYLFVFGLGGFEGLGFDGLAYASFGIRVFLAFMMVIYVSKKFVRFSIDFSFIQRTLKFSLPIAFMFFVEVLAFCLVSILAGGMGVAISAANTIIMNIASVTFMVPLSISSAVSVKVGAMYGADDMEGVKDYSFAAIFMSMTFMAFSALMYILFPKSIMALVSTDTEVVAIGVSLLLIVAIFQLVDGLQITFSGILRGLSITKEPFICILVGYWLFGLPVGIYLAYRENLNAQGLWIGLALSLTLVALFLGVLFKKNLGKPNKK